MAPSKESGALAELFKTFAQNFPSDGNVYKQRAIYDQVHKAAAEVPGVSYEDAHIIGGSLPCIWIRPDGATNNHVILFMHGGGQSIWNRYTSGVLMITESRIQLRFAQQSQKSRRSSRESLQLPCLECGLPTHAGEYLPRPS